MKRYNILTLMTAVLYVAIGLGALFNPNDKWIWVSVVFSLTAVILAIATVMAFASDGRARMAWTGFAVCGWSYLLLFFRQMSELLAGLTFLEIQLVENQVIRVWSNRSRR